jgi:hypothetical protein
MMELLSDTETNTCKKNILTIHKILRIMQRNNPDAENQIFVYILTYSYICSRDSHSEAKQYQGKVNFSLVTT